MTETALDHLRGKLQGVRNTGPGFAALCPAHDDRSPSLSVDPRKDGKGALVHCHAGCDIHDVVAALGLTVEALWDDQKIKAAYSPTRTYVYPGGRQVHRKPNGNGGKTFPQSGNKSDRSLFGSDLITPDTELVIAAEGEKDCELLQALGAVAVCSAMGAGKAHLADWSPVAGKIVIVIADADEVGRKHAADIHRLLEGRAKSVSVVECKAKDFADAFLAGYGLADLTEIEQPDDEVRTVPWPRLDPAALHGHAGKIVRLLEEHTEADPAALLVQILHQVGAVVGRDPHIVVSNKMHPAITSPLIVGATSNGAKGTSTDVVNAVRRRADELAAGGHAINAVSGLSSAEGLIEAVVDGDPDDENNTGVIDKRLLVIETEYCSVLKIQRREGNTLGPVLRQAWDGDTLRTLTRKKNRLVATNPHICITGHVTPREFRAAIRDADLAGGSVNRLLIVLSRRSKFHTRFGNVPDEVLTEAAKLFKDAIITAREAAGNGGTRSLSDDFWALWDEVYPELARERPESDATDATARGTTQVLRLALQYSILDRAELVEARHLAAALALWKYCEHGARWLFSSHEADEARAEGDGLHKFIFDGGPDGRSRTEISVDHFQRNKSAEEISAELEPLVHHGAVVEVRQQSGPGGGDHALRRFAVPAVVIRFQPTSRSGHVCR